MANAANTNSSGGGNSSTAAGEDYYRELLARVDNAIVETREPEQGNVCGEVEVCCKGCIQRVIGATLVVAAIATECCVSLKLAVTGSDGNNSNSNHHNSNNGQL